MKIRALKKLLPKSNYIYQNCGEYLAIGTGYVYDIIKVNVSTGHVKWKHNTKDTIKDHIICILQGMAKSGQLLQYLEGKDELNNGVKVYCVKEGELIESVTEEYNYSNITQEGFLLYENVWFLDVKDAIDYAFFDAKGIIGSCEAEIEECEIKIGEHRHRIEVEKKIMLKMKLLKRQALS